MLEITLALLNAVQAVGIAWIVSRQQQVKTTLRDTNGAVTEQLATMKREMDEIYARVFELPILPPAAT